jgi:hypothetical protein
MISFFDLNIIFQNLKEIIIYLKNLFNLNNCLLYCKKNKNYIFLTVEKSPMDSLEKGLGAGLFSFHHLDKCLDPVVYRGL